MSEAGSGKGKGGGSGGAIRDAGGAFGKKEAAQEEQYFRQLVRISIIIDGSKQIYLDLLILINLEKNILQSFWEKFRISLCFDDFLYKQF